jgi:hypothetical protein
MTMINGAGMAAHYNTIAATRAQRTDPMKAVADTLGLSSDELKNQLRSGMSLLDVATQRGVDHDRLIAPVRDGLPTEASSDATRGAEEVAKPPGGPRGQVAGLYDGAKADRLGNLLDVDAGELTSKVANAKELIDLMRDKGVDLGQLRSILNSGDLVDVAM